MSEQTPQDQTGDYVCHQVCKSDFYASPQYTNIEPIGMGAFGIVVSAVFNETTVAIKKISNPFANPILAKRFYY